MFLFSEDANEASTEQQQQILPSSIQHAVPLSDALPPHGHSPVDRRSYAFRGR